MGFGVVIEQNQCLLSVVCQSQRASTPGRRDVVPVCVIPGPACVLRDKLRFVYVPMTTRRPGWTYSWLAPGMPGTVLAVCHNRLQNCQWRISFDRKQPIPFCLLFGSLPRESSLSFHIRALWLGLIFARLDAIIPIDLGKSETKKHQQQREKKPFLWLVSARF